MALDTDIAAAIDNDLPNQVGIRLKERLAQAEEDSINLVGARSQIRDLQAEVQELRQLQARWADLEVEEANLRSKQKVVDRNEIRLEILEQQMKARLQDNMTLLTQVFKGPASKVAFDLWGHANGLMSDSGMISNPDVNLSGSIGQGDQT